MVPPTTPEAPNVDNDDVPEVTWAELALAVQWSKAKNTTLGSDGIPGRAWLLALNDEEPASEPCLRGLLSACFEKGQFPKHPKEGAPGGLPIRLPACIA